VIETHNLSGSRKSAKEIIEDLSLRIGEVGHLIAAFSKWPTTDYWRLRVTARVRFKKPRLRLVTHSLSAGDFWWQALQKLKV